MPAPTNGNSPTLELNQTIAELRQGLADAIGKKASIETVTKMQTQLDALDVKLSERHTSGIPQKGLFDTLKENESVQRFLKDRKGRAYFELDANQTAGIMERKSIISAFTSGSAGSDTLAPLGSMTTGVLPIDRTPGITLEARQTLKIRDVLSSRPTQMQVVDFVKVSTPMTIASPVPEASIKPENSVIFTSQSERVKTIATWIPCTKQAAEDMTELMGFIQTSLPYYVDLATELQLLAGDGAGEDLHGIIPQASSFNTSLLSVSQGYNRIDIIGAAIEQIQVAKEIDPTFVVLHPSDWWRIRLTKDAFGRYIINAGDPQTVARPSIFGLDVVVTTSMPVGAFLVGSGSPAAAEIRDRAGMQVEVSSEHADFFVRNLLAIRAERRLAMVVKRGASFIQGSFVTSPVGQ